MGWKPQPGTWHRLQATADTSSYYATHVHRPNSTFKLSLWHSVEVELFPSGVQQRCPSSFILFIIDITKFCESRSALGEGTGCRVHFKSRHLNEFLPQVNKVFHPAGVKELAPNSSGKSKALTCSSAAHRKCFCGPITLSNCLQDIHRPRRDRTFGWPGREIRHKNRCKYKYEYYVIQH